VHVQTIIIAKHNYTIDYSKKERYECILLQGKLNRSFQGMILA